MNIQVVWRIFKGDWIIQRGRRNSAKKNIAEDEGEIDIRQVVEKELTQPVVYC
jgi:hypothetical protein